MATVALTKKMRYFFLVQIVMFTACKPEMSQVDKNKINHAIDQHNEIFHNENFERRIDSLDTKNNFEIKNWQNGDSKIVAEEKAIELSAKLTAEYHWKLHQSDSAVASKYKTNYFVGVDSNLTFEKYITFCKDNDVELLDGFKFLKQKK